MALVTYDTLSATLGLWSVELLKPSRLLTKDLPRFDEAEKQTSSYSLAAEGLLLLLVLLRDLAV